jgi:hypothetical protein
VPSADEKAFLNTLKRATVRTYKTSDHKMSTDLTFSVFVIIVAIVGFVILTAVVVKTSIFWDITP